MSTTIYSNLFLDNKYTRWYFKIVIHGFNNTIQRILDRRGQSNNSQRYFENHHIIPKSMGGTDYYQNRVLLTAREHFICHALLWRMTSGQDKYKMAFAWRCMKNGKNGIHKRYTSRLFESSRVKFKYSEESKAKMSKAKKGKKQTPEHVRNNVLANTGKKRSKETRQKISDANRGRVLSKESRMKTSKSLSGKNHFMYGKQWPRKNCVHCGKDYPLNWIKRHTEKCKS